MKQKIPALFISFMLVFTLAGCTAEKEQPSAYAQVENWAYLEVDKTADADVFFICPTVYGGDEDSFNMPMDDEDAKATFWVPPIWKKASMTRRPDSLLPITVRPG